jgi:adenylate cyclase
MGDGLLVFFGAPIVREDDPERAIACAVAMQLAMDKINEQIQSRGFAPLEIGIGINTSEVVVGNIGSEKRLKYSAIGNGVNLTYRIESYSIGGQILISE